MIEAPAWSELNASFGAGVRVLVVDSGVEKEHPIFDGREIPCWQVVQSGNSNLVVENPSGGDVLGHGTAVLGILHQYLPEAQLDSLRVFGSNLRAGSGAILTGLRWAIKQGYHLINCSFGSPDPKYLPAYKRVIDEAYCKNVTLVAASNNVNFRKEEFPSAFPSVISTDFDPVVDLNVERRSGQLVEFVSRGSNVRVAWKGGTYRTVSGSSFAAPHLTSLVGRMHQLRPYWTIHHFKTALYELATLCPIRKYASNVEEEQ